MSPIPADAFTRIRGRAASVIAKYGTDVLFRGPGEVAHQNEDGSWTEATDETVFDGIGIQTRGDPDEYGLALSKAGLVLKNPVTVLVAAIKRDGVTAMAGIPTPGLTMVWAGLDYDVKAALPVAPNGNPIYYVVVGDA